MERRDVGVREAAEILNVPEGYLGQILEGGGLQVHGEQGERRIWEDEPLEYKARVEAERDALLAELTEEAQRLGLY